MKGYDNLDKFFAVVNEVLPNKTIKRIQVGTENFENKKFNIYRVKVSVDGNGGNPQVYVLDKKTYTFTSNIVDGSMFSDLDLSENIQVIVQPADQDSIEYVKVGSYSNVSKDLNIRGIDAIGIKVGSTYTASSPYIPNIEVEYSYDEEIKIKDAVKELQESIKPNTLNIGNSDLVLFEGSSLTASVCHPQGFGWLEKLNDIVDIPMSNSSYASQSRGVNMRVLANNEAISNGIKPRSLNITHIFWDNNTNNSLGKLDGYRQLFQAKAITDSYNAVMLLGTEELLTPGENLCKSFAVENKIPYSSAEHIVTKCYGRKWANKMFSEGTTHRGWRAVAPYQLHQDLFVDFPIRKAIKLYRVRPKYLNQLSGVTDLAYDNNKQRLYKFMSISAGKSLYTQSDFDFRYADNLASENKQYVLDTEQQESSYTAKYDVMDLMGGKEVSFNRYALIEGILDVRTLETISFVCNCDVNPTNVFVSRFKITSEGTTDPNTNFIFSEWKSVDFDYVEEKLTVDIQDTSRCLMNNKIKILIECADYFNISNPIFNYNGDKRSDRELFYKQRLHGGKMYEDTQVTTTNWATYGNVSDIVFPEGVESYTGYNEVDSVIKIADNDSYITRTITNDKKINKLIVRIIAQNFYKVMTKKYSGEEYRDFVSDTPLLEPYEYDYGGLILTVTTDRNSDFNIENTDYVKEFIVQSGWSELYAEFDGIIDTSQFTIKIQRNNHTDGIYSSDDCPLLINDISVEYL